MIWFGYLLWIMVGSVFAESYGPVCSAFATECHPETCTPNAFVGSQVDFSKCPFARQFDGIIQRTCTACPSGKTCNANGICVSASNLLGKSCSTDAQCNALIPDISEFPNRCHPGTNKCVVNKIGLLLPGDTGCSANNDCYGASTCSGGTCQGAVSCSETRECAPGKRCSSGVCTDTVGLGDFCDASTDCPIFQMCILGQCRNRFSLDVNALCGFEEITREYGCSQGLQCIQTGDTSEYHCLPSPIGGEACNSLITEECGQSFVCNCDPDFSRGTCKPETEDGRCAIAWNQYFQCADINGCRWENTERIFEGSCVRDACFSQWSTLQKCRYPRQEDVYSSQTCEVVRRTEIKSGNVIAPLEDFDNACAKLPTIFI